MGTDVKSIVRENVRALLGLQDEESGVSKLIAKGITNGNAQRVLGGQTSIGLNLLCDLAKALRVEPWQLCAKNLGAGAAPLPDRWPFEEISKDSWESLSERQKGQVELAMREAIEAIKARPVKRHATAT
jgi:hypothetical protein